MNCDIHTAGRNEACITRRTLLRGGLAGGFLLLGGVTAWQSGNRRLVLARSAEPAMGTLAEVLVAHPGSDASDLARAALEEIRDVERRMTRFDPSSEVGRVNANPDRYFTVSRATGQVVSTALAIARASDGSFDPSLGRLEAQWGFYEKKPPTKLPTARDAQKAHDPGYRNIELRGDSARPRLRIKGPDIQIDLGGIAKGYAVDRAVDLLRDHGVVHALVNIGGDLHALGGHPDGRPWQVGVRHPRQAGRFLTVLALRDKAVATSGDYENFFVADGRRYHHLLDPRTRAPAQFHRSFTVTASSAMIADALATAAFASAPLAAERLMRRLAPGTWLAADNSGALRRG